MKYVSGSHLRPASRCEETKEHRNRRVAIEVIGRAGGKEVTAMAVAVAMNRTTVTLLLAELVAEGLVIRRVENKVAWYRLARAEERSA